jgi:hypothetical protein
MITRIITITILSILPAFGLDTLVAAQKDGFKTEYELTYREKYGHRLTVSYYKDSVLLRQSKTYIKHDIYRFCAGDINSDSILDVCVGLVKTTKFDPKYRKRLFVYTHRDGVLCPLWMGSKVGNNLQDFLANTNRGVISIRTIEECPKGGFAVGEYKWKSFGLVWQRYVKRGIDYENALATFVF